MRNLSVKRNVGSEKIEEFVALLLEEWPDYDGKDLRRSLFDFEREGAYFLLVEENGNSLGFSILQPCHYTPNSFIIQYLLVRKSERGRGLGRVLIDRMKGFGSLYVDIDDPETNETQQKIVNCVKHFYEKMGFGDTGIRIYLRDEPSPRPIYHWPKEEKFEPKSVAKDFYYTQLNPQEIKEDWEKILDKTTFRGRKILTEKDLEELLYEGDV